VYQVYRVSYRIVRVCYRIVRESYPIVRVSYRIVYHVKNNVAGTVYCIVLFIMSRITLRVLYIVLMNFPLTTLDILP
jgi:hypothetical protein